MVPKSVITQVSDSRGVISNGFNHGFYDWLFECHGFWHNAILIIPSILFVLYLALQARHTFLKLSLARSYIIVSYNASLWFVTLLNLAWCFLQAWECTSRRELAWNLLSLFTTSGMLFLEVSLVGFLLQGNNAGGLEAMRRTFGISMLVVGLDILLKAIYLYVFGIPLFVDSNENTNNVKWNLLVIHKLLLTTVYGFIMFMYHSGWRETLPAKIAFYKYVAVMFIFNAIGTLACGLTGNGVAFGFWLDPYLTEKKTSVFSCSSLATFSKALFALCSQVVSYCCCLLPCILPSFLVYNLPNRLFSGGKFSFGHCVLFRDERCGFLRHRLGMMFSATKLTLHQCQDYVNEITMPADRNIMYKDVYLLEPQVFCYLMNMTLYVYGSPWCY